MSSYKRRPSPGNTDWFVHDRFGMFVHWGLYAMPARHEWIKTNEKISEEKYDLYFKHFNPDLYDPRDWARRARAAGATVTAKEPCHEGYEPAHVLVPFDDAICASTERTLTLTLTLPRAVRFNMLELGGIFPFNTVVFDGSGLYSYRIDVFDGSKYVTVYENSKPYKRQIVHLPETYRTSYKLRIVSASPFKVDPKPEVYEL